MPLWLRSSRVVVGLSVALAVLLCALLAPVIAPHDPDEQNLLTTLLPAAWQAGGDHAHLLGTDALGRDVSRGCCSARASPWRSRSRRRLAR